MCDLLWLSKSYLSLLPLLQPGKVQGYLNSLWCVDMCAASSLLQSIISLQPFILHSCDPGTATLSFACAAT